LSWELCNIGTLGAVSPISWKEKEELLLTPQLEIYLIYQLILIDFYVEIEPRVKIESE